MNQLTKYTNRFFRALFPKLTPGDIEFLRSHLNKQEQILFYRMSAMDQKHCLNTTYAVQADHASKSNQKMLVKVALLHDIGKVIWSPPIMYRVWGVLIDSLLPPLGHFLAKRGRKEKSSKLARTLYIKREHGNLGVKILKDLDWGEKPLYLIAHHHDAVREKKLPELDILWNADNEN